MKRIVISLLTLGMLACETPFEPVLEKDSKVVVNSFFRPESPIHVNLSKSNFILASEQETAVNHALVTITGTNGNTETLMEDGNGTYSSIFTPGIQEEYLLTVLVDGFPEITSSNSIPKPVSIQSFSVETQRSSINLGESGYRASLSFEDPADMENYYGVEVIIVDEGTHNILGGKVGFLLLEDPGVGLSGNVDINVGNPGPGPGNEIIFFDDIRIEGQQHTLQFFIAPVNIDFSKEIDIYVVLKSISKQYYDYLLAANFQKDIEEKGTLSEPVQIANNIKNGLGIFAGYSFTTLKADLIE